MSINSYITNLKFYTARSKSITWQELEILIDRFNVLSIKDFQVEDIRDILYNLVKVYRLLDKEHKQQIFITKISNEILTKLETPLQNIFNRINQIEIQVECLADIAASFSILNNTSNLVHQMQTEFVSLINTLPNHPVNAAHMIFILSNLLAIGYKDDEIIRLIIDNFKNYVSEFNRIGNFIEVLNVQCNTHCTNNLHINDAMITNLDTFIEKEDDMYLFVNYISGVLPGIAYYSNINSYQQIYNRWFRTLDIANDLGHAEPDDLQDLIQGLLILCSVDAYIDPALYTRLIALLGSNDDDDDDEYQPPINILLPSLLLLAKNQVSYTEHKRFYDAQYARIQEELENFSVEDLATIMYTIIIHSDKDMRDNYIDLAFGILDHVSYTANVISTAQQFLSRMGSNEFDSNYNICRSNFMYFFNLLTHDNLPFLVQYFIKDNKDICERLNRIIAKTLDVSVSDLSNTNVMVPIILQLYTGDFLEKNFAITLISFWRAYTPRVFQDLIELETVNTSNKETVKLIPDVFAPILSNLDSESILSWIISSDEKRSNVKYQSINNAKRKLDDSIADKDEILQSKILHRTEDREWYDDGIINNVLRRLFDGNNDIQVTPAISSILLEHQVDLNAILKIIEDAISISNSNNQESRILVPFTMNNNHWIGIVLNICPGVIKLEVLDSILSNHYDQAVYNKLEEFWTELIKSINSDIRVTTSYIRNVLLQEDSYNCGPCMIENIKHHLLGQKIVYDMSQARAMHIQMSLQVIQDPEELLLSGEHQQSLEE